jgi:hypothetical protein
MASGLEKTPPVFSSPLWKDRFFWLLLATLAFWSFVVWLLFF